MISNWRVHCYVCKMDFLGAYVYMQWKGKLVCLSVHNQCPSFYLCLLKLRFIHFKFSIKFLLSLGGVCNSILSHSGTHPFLPFLSWPSSCWCLGSHLMVSCCSRYPWKKFDVSAKDAIYRCSETINLCGLVAVAIQWRDGHVSHSGH